MLGDAVGFEVEDAEVVARLVVEVGAVVGEDEDEVLVEVLLGFS